MPSRFEGSEHGRQPHKLPVHPLRAEARPESGVRQGTGTPPLSKVPSEDLGGLFPGPLAIWARSVALGSARFTSSCFPHYDELFPSALNAIRDEFQFVWRKIALLEERFGFFNAGTQ